MSQEFLQTLTFMFLLDSTISVIDVILYYLLYEWTDAVFRIVREKLVKGVGVKDFEVIRQREEGFKTTVYISFHVLCGSDNVLVRTVGLVRSSITLVYGNGFNVSDDRTKTKIGSKGKINVLRVPKRTFRDNFIW